MFHHRKKNKPLSWFQHPYVPYLYVLPALMFVSIFSLAPVVLTFIIGLTKWSIFGQAQWRGLGNYIELFFSDPTFLIALKNNLYWVIVSLGLIPMAFILAVLVDEFKRAADYIRALIFIPSTLSFVVIGLIFGFIYNPVYGLLNRFLQNVGLAKFQQEWLSNPNINTFSIIGVRYWASLGFCMVIFLAGLRGIPRELYEAARIDGASFWDALWHITIPMMRNTLIVVSIFVTMGSLKQFALPWVLTEGGPGYSSSTLATYMYSQGFVAYRMGYAGAIASSIFSLVFIVTILQLKFGRQEALY